MKCTMLMGCFRIISMRRSDEAEMAIRYDARHHSLFSPEMCKQMIIATSDLVSRQKYPCGWHHLFCIESHIQREWLSSDLEMLCIEHEDADMLGCIPCDEGTLTDASRKCSSHSPECRHVAHAPTSCEPAIRAAVQKI